MSRKNNLYLGKSGEYAAISEFLARGWNVALPVIDMGDDMFVVEDDSGLSFRVQVKSTFKSMVSSEIVQFHLDGGQLQKATFPELIYVFAIRNETR